MIGRSPSRRPIDCGKRQPKLTYSAGLWGTAIADTRTGNVRREPTNSDSPNIRTLPVAARWAHNRDREPQPTPHRSAPKRTTPVVGKRTELARDAVAEGDRIIYGPRVDGVVRVTNRLATPGDRRGSYLIERNLQTKDELVALVRDYLLCRARHRTSSKRSATA